MKKQIVTACLYTVITAVLLGIVYPLAITGLARLFFRDKADGQLVQRNGELAGSRLIGQPFTGPGYFHSRPSAAGTGYDAGNSSGSNFGTFKQSVDRSRDCQHQGRVQWRSRAGGPCDSIGFRPRP